MKTLTSVKRLYIRFKSLVNDFVYSFGRAALLLLAEVQNHTVPVRERRRIRVKLLNITLHVSHVLFVRHQGSKIVHTASGTCHTGSLTPDDGRKDRRKTYSDIQ